MLHGHQVGGGLRADPEKFSNGLFFAPIAHAVGQLGKRKSRRSSNAVHAVNEQRTFTVLFEKGDAFFNLCPGGHGISKAGIVAIFEGEHELWPVCYAQTLTLARILAGEDGIPAAAMTVCLGKATHANNAGCRLWERGGHVFFPFE